jgi:hypothetical protein
MKFHGFFVSALLALLLSAPPSKDGSLSEEEKRDGWELIFDGKSTKGWMTPDGKPADASHVKDKCLNPHPTQYMLVYEKPLDDFILALDFKISPGCNSGVFVRTSPLEARPGKSLAFNGIEIAIDDTRTDGYHDSGAIYDLVKPTQNAMKPAGEWNHLKITCMDNLIEVVLNGEKVSRMDLDEWSTPNRRPDGTAHKFDVAFKTHPRKGYIGLQDHGWDCWFKNIKLKKLEPIRPRQEREE